MQIRHEIAGTRVWPTLDGMSDLICVEGERLANAPTATNRAPFAYQNTGVFPMHSIACFFGLVFLVILALIAIPLIILMAKLVGFAIFWGVIALIALGIWKLFDLAEPRYWPY